MKLGETLDEQRNFATDRVRAERERPFPDRIAGVVVFGLAAKLFAAASEGQKSIARFTALLKKPRTP